MDKTTLDKHIEKMEYCEKALHDIAIKLGIKVFVEHNFAKFIIEAYFIDDNALYKTQHIIMMVDDVPVGSWEDDLFKHLANIFDKEKEFETYYYHNKPITVKKCDHEQPMWLKKNPYLSKLGFKYIDLIDFKKVALPEIKNVKFNGPATIIFWSDDTKTVVKAQDEEFDPEKGIAMAIAKKALGNKHDYYNVIAKYTKRYYKEKR